MTSARRSARPQPPRYRPPAKPEPRMDPVIHAAQKKRYRLALGMSVLCVFLAFVGIYSRFTLHQAWGLLLFVLAMAAGLGTQVWFVVGMVKAARLEKGA